MSQFLKLFAIICDSFPSEEEGGFELTDEAFAFFRHPRDFRCPLPLFLEAGVAPHGPTARGVTIEELDDDIITIGFN